MVKDGEHVLYLSPQEVFGKTNNNVDNTATVTTTPIYTGISMSDVEERINTLKNEIIDNIFEAFEKRLWTKSGIMIKCNEKVLEVENAT
jgi:hypothetical protein